MLPQLGQAYARFDHQHEEARARLLAILPAAGRGQYLQGGGVSAFL